MGTRQAFEEGLTAISQDILRMAVMVEEALARAIESLVERSEGKARDVVAGDEAINRLEQAVQERCVVLMAREQPVATDLRRLVACLEIASQLERMGDHAQHVARGTLRILPEPYMKPLVDIPRMSQLIISMLREAISALLDNDAARARAVAPGDRDVDNLHEQVMRELFTYMMEDTGRVAQAISLLFVSRFLERMGDHVTNICEWVVYGATGERVELNT
jgi:phosphate transport system protein